MAGIEARIGAGIEAGMGAGSEQRSGEERWPGSEQRPGEERGPGQGAGPARRCLRRAPRGRCPVPVRPRGRRFRRVRSRSLHVCRECGVPAAAAAMSVPATASNLPMRLLRRKIHKRNLKLRQRNLKLLAAQGEGRGGRCRAASPQ